MNYFAPYTSAERYAKGRPEFHGNTMQHIQAFLKLENKLANALDIACGTGLSTKALLTIANKVYGTDSSKSMIDFALQKDEINYLIAHAEQQPFESDFFDLITVSSGVHWFDIDKFLLETNRLLKNESWLILYDNFFLGEMEGNLKFKVWYEEVYSKKFPSPKRNDDFEWTSKNLKNTGFDLVNEEQFNNTISFNENELILYFTTQSNIISAVENNLVTYEEIEEWLGNELSKFFQNDRKKEIIYFGNWIKYLRKN